MRHGVEVIDDGCVELSISTSLAGTLGLKQNEKLARQSNYDTNDVALKEPQGVVASDARVDVDSDPSRDDFEASEGRSFGINVAKGGRVIKNSCRDRSMQLKNEEK